MPTLNQITVPVIKAFDGHAVGDSITVTPLEASILARKRIISLTRGYQTRELTAKDPEPEPEPEAPRRRRRYRRTDMQAEE
jgi:hypothetical protein